MSRVELELAGRTDAGCVRDRNEDSLLLAADLGLAVVADGMGGHNAGEVASRLATETIFERARRVLSGDEDVPVKDGDDRARTSRQLEHCIHAANSAIYGRAQAVTKQHGMGTTVVALLAGEKAVAVGHVGDSRLYLWRRGRLQALTEDHSLVMDQVRHGILTREQAEKSNFHNILTRALGTEETVAVDLQEHPALAGDVFLMCSDGLTKMLKDEDIAQALSEGATSSEVVDRLVEEARRAGGLDNVTVAVAKVLDAKPSWLGRLAQLVRRQP